MGTLEGLMGFIWTISSQERIPNGRSEVAITDASWINSSNRSPFPKGTLSFLDRAIVELHYWLTHPWPPLTWWVIYIKSQTWSCGGHQKYELRLSELASIFVVHMGQLSISLVLLVLKLILLNIAWAKLGHPLQASFVSGYILPTVTSTCLNIFY